MLLLLFFNCLFLLHFSDDLCINRCLDDYRNKSEFFLFGSLCFLEMSEGSEECDKMFNEVDDGEWDISDDDDDYVGGDSEKE